MKNPNSQLSSNCKLKKKSNENSFLNTESSYINNNGLEKYEGLINYPQEKIFDIPNFGNNHNKPNIIHPAKNPLNNNFISNNNNYNNKHITSKTPERSINNSFNKSKGRNFKPTNAPANVNNNLALNKSNKKKIYNIKDESNNTPMVHNHIRNTVRSASFTKKECPDPQLNGNTKENSNVNNKIYTRNKSKNNYETTKNNIFPNQIPRYSGNSNVNDQIKNNIILNQQANPFNNFNPFPPTNNYLNNYNSSSNTNTEPSFMRNNNILIKNYDTEFNERGRQNFNQYKNLDLINKSASRSNSAGYARKPSSDWRKGDDSIERQRIHNFYNNQYSSEINENLLKNEEFSTQYPDRSEK